MSGSVLPLGTRELRVHVLVPLIVLLTLMPGCVEPPERQEPLAGLGLQSGPPAYPNLTVALVLSENTKNTMQYAYKSGATMAYSPEKILEGQIEVYRRNFKAAVRVEKADEGRTINADLIVVHDFFAEVGQSLRLDAGAILLTLDNQQVDKILIKTERPLPFIKSPGVFGQAVEGAAEETLQKLEVALRSLTKLAELNQARAVAASSPQATQAPRIAPPP